MSIFGALTTAVSGLDAQSSAFTNISNNIANSQSTGYKDVGTNFIDYLTDSTSTTNGPESVVAQPAYTNDAQGPITQSTDKLALAINGQGFFSVSTASASSSGTASAATQSFSAQPEYTRAGDFTLDKNGYLVNGAGDYLNGWSVNPATGAVNTSTLAPIQIAQGVNSPVATKNVTLSAELPATPTPGQPVASQVNVYDSLGTLHQLDLSWTQNTTNDWTLSVSAPDSKSPAIGSADVTFGANGVAAGTIGNLSKTSNVTASSFGANSPATLSFSTDFGNGPQPITLSLGNFGSTTGVTQYAGTSYNPLGTTQDGQAQGSFSNLTIDTQGNVSINYSNGNSTTVAQIPIATFNAPDALQAQSGQAYTASKASGSASINAVGADGAGSLVTGSVEGSNVDISTEFTKLITAQEAYSANAKVVTTANQLSQTTLNMIQ